MKSHLLQILLTNGISLCLFSFRMISAINFYNQPIVARSKIDDIITYDMLP